MFRPKFLQLPFSQKASTQWACEPFSGLGLCLPPFCAWGLVIDIGVGRIFVPFLVLGDVASPLLDWGLFSHLFLHQGVVSPFLEWVVVVSPFWWGLVVCPNPVLFWVCIFHNKKMHVYLIVGTFILLTWDPGCIKQSTCQIQHSHEKHVMQRSNLIKVK